MKSPAECLTFLLHFLWPVTCYLRFVPAANGSSRVHNQSESQLDSCCNLSNRPFAWSSQMVQNHPCWWASCAAGLPKQRQVHVDSEWYELHCFGSPTGQLAHQREWFCTMWLYHAKGLLSVKVRAPNPKIFFCSNKSSHLFKMHCAFLPLFNPNLDFLQAVLAVIKDYESAFDAI